VTTSECSDQPAEQRDESGDEDDGDDVAFEDISENQEKHGDCHGVSFLAA
jgi:hypothetical protein